MFHENNTLPLGRITREVIDCIIPMTGTRSFFISQEMRGHQSNDLLILNQNIQTFFIRISN